MLAGPLNSSIITYKCSLYIFHSKQKSRDLSPSSGSFVEQLYISGLTVRCYCALCGMMIAQDISVSRVHEAL